MDRRVVRGSLMLVLTALIWGLAFTAQSVGVETIGVFTFTFARNALAVVVLSPLLLRGRRAPAGAARPVGGWKQLLIGGLCCGAVMFAGSVLQLFGIAQTSVGKAGFITTLYILIVPVFGLLLGRKPKPAFWLSVVIALAGMYLLCVRQGFSMGRGDLLVLLCAVAFAGHILVVDHFSARLDGVQLSILQFLVSALLSLLPMLVIERPALESLRAAWAPILYTGALSSGVGFTLQVLAQKDVNPVVASLLMSLESVFAALGGWIILGQALSGREILGCALVFAAVLLVQWPSKKERMAGGTI